MFAKKRHKSIFSHSFEMIGKYLHEDIKYKIIFMFAKGTNQFFLILLTWSENICMKMTFKKNRKNIEKCDLFLILILMFFNCLFRLYKYLYNWKL